MLFRVGDFNVCPPQLPINEDGQWEALGAEERERRRYAYAAVISAGLRADAERLRSAWTATDGLLDDAKAAGLGSVFDTPDALIDEWLGALFHLDFVSKDKRLAVPSGISADCGRAVCSDKLEFRSAAANGLALRANLRAATALLSGDGGLGFYGLLRHDGAGDLAEQLEMALFTATATARSIEVTWSDLLGSDPEALRNLHRDVEVVTDLLKGPFMTVLNLSVPEEGAGDSD
jgi:predicted lipoprotein